MPGEVLGAASWFTVAVVIIAGIISWATQAWLYKHKRIDEATEKKIDHVERLEIHRDELTFDLLENARKEMQAVRVEADGLRSEIRKLRSMEDHFYHFQQSLDHLEAVLFAETDEDRAVAERNARGFLVRMRRLNEAKGTITNEVQRTESKVRLLSRNQDPVVNKKGPKNG